MKGNRAVVGVFSYLDDAVKAVHKAKESSLEYHVYAPVPTHELEHATSETRSWVRAFTSVGAATGLVFGFTLAIWCSLDWPLRVSAKDIVSVPAFVVIGYECTILFGGIATLLGLFYLSGVPDLLRKVGYDPRFSDDKFGVVVGCDSGQVDEVKAKLVACGADEVQVRDAL